MKKTITRRSLLAALASFSFFIPTTALSAKGRELAIFYSFSGNSKRVAEVFQKLEHCDVLEIKTLEPYNAYNVDFSHYFRWLFANFRECSLIS